MKTLRLTIALTVINLLILLSVLLFSFTNDNNEVLPVLRGHAFELIDSNGKVRAEIKIRPAEPSVKMPDGTTGYPESVLFRLFDSEGGPNVKISATEDGSGMVLGGESGFIQILSRDSNPTVKLSSKKGGEQVMQIEQPK